MFGSNADLTSGMISEMSNSEKIAKTDGAGEAKGVIPSDAPPKVQNPPPPPPPKPKSANMEEAIERY